MIFSEINHSSLETGKIEKSGFDVDKRAEVSEKQETQGKEKFDVDKRAEIEKNDEIEPGKNVNVQPYQDEHSENKQTYIDINERKPIQNKIDGLRREDEVQDELEKQYPIEKGYSIESEVYLRDEKGEIVKDPETGEARRIDFVVINGGKVVDSVEVTSKTADKTEQSAKEQRIRDNGGNYIKDSNGNLLKISDNVQTRIERRD